MSALNSPKKIGAPKIQVHAFADAERLADRIRGGERQHSTGDQTRAEQADRKQRYGGVTGDRLECRCRILCGLDLPYAGCM